MLEPQDKEIDGTVFRYQPMTATPARKLFDELVKRFGPAIGEALGKIENISTETEDGNQMDIWASVAKAVGGGITGFSQALDPPFHAQLAKDLGKLTLYQNKEGNMVPLKDDVREMMFGVKLTTETKWILFCLEVQFSDFLDLFRSTLSEVGSLKIEVG